MSTSGPARPYPTGVSLLLGARGRHASPADRAPGPALRRALARELAAPFAFAWLGLGAVVMAREAIPLSDLVVNRGVSSGEAIGLAALEALPVLAAMLPFALAIGWLVALGRLGADRELLALESCGVRPLRLLGPVALATLPALALSLSLALSLFAAPWAHRAVEARLGAVAERQPWSELRAGVVSRFGGWQLEAREVSARGDVLRGVLLWLPDLHDTVFARRARVARGPGGGVALTLEDGGALLPASEGAGHLRFEALTAELPANAARALRNGDAPGGWASRATGELAAAARGPDPGAALELHRRLAAPASTALLGALALPLFLAWRPRSRSGGVVLGVLVTAAALLAAQLGEGLVQAGRLAPAAGVWLPNAGLAALAAALLWRARGAGPPGESALGRRAARGRGARRAAPRRHALDRSLAARFASSLALCFAVLFAAYLLVDVTERLDWFARYQATGAEVLRFYGARVWLLASRVVPLSLLVATALFVGRLAADGELVGLRASGLSLPRALAPALAIALLVTPAYFGLRNAVVPRTNALADRLKQTEIKQDAYREIAERRKVAVWRRFGSRLLAAERFDAERGDARALTIFEMDAQGLPRRRADASAAHHVGGGVWRLRDARAVELRDGRAREVAAAAFVELGEALPAEVDTMHLSIAQLADEIEAVEAGGYDASALRVDYHAKLADPWSCVVLPAAALFFAVGGPPFPLPLRTLAVAAALGAGYVLATGAFTAFGRAGALPAPLAGWGPLLAFAGIAAGQAIRLARRR